MFYGTIFRISLILCELLFNIFHDNNRKDSRCSDIPSASVQRYSKVWFGCFLLSSPPTQPATLAPFAHQTLISKKITMSSTVPVPAASNPMRPVLPSSGVAVVKSVLSGDTVVLLGRATQAGAHAPEVVFTFERVTAPR